jgi:hypothetical protein
MLTAPLSRGCFGYAVPIERKSGRRRKLAGGFPCSSSKPRPGYVPDLQFQLVGLFSALVGAFAKQLAAKRSGSHRANAVIITAPAREMAPLLLERTGGNPLFMTSIANQIGPREASGRTLAAIMSIPNDVRRFIGRQLDELSQNDRNLLTAASVIRREFATAAVAAVREIEAEGVETACTRLARQGVFIVKSGLTTWPDGTRTALNSRRSSRRISNAATSLRARFRTTSAFAAKAMLTPTSRQSDICDGRSMRSETWRPASSVPEPKSNCSSDATFGLVGA